MLNAIGGGIASSSAPHHCLGLNVAGKEKRTVEAALGVEENAPFDAPPPYAAERVAQEK
jgi:hypothetical protein